MVAELGLHEGARRVVELALLVAAVDRVLEALVDPLPAGVLGGPERDVRRKQDRRVEQDEPLDVAGTTRGVLEREPCAERMAEPDRGPPTSPRRGGEVVVDPPRRLAR